MKFKRLVPTGLNEAQLETALSALVNAVSEDWLNKGDDKHPLRALWRRSDVLSTNELYAIGLAIHEVGKRDPSWMKEQVKLLRSSEKNNYLGASAEILTAFMLHAENHPVTPAKLNQAGFDAIMQLKDHEKSIRFSIKNYGMSKHEEYFNRYAAETELIIQKLLKKYSYYPVTVWIDCPTKYPSTEKWKSLHANLDRAFKVQKNAKEPFTALVNQFPEWIIMASPNIKANKNLHPGFNSYTLVMSCVHHPNESDNLISKLQDACSNLAMHSALENDSQKNFLFIHVSPLASVQKCTEWLDQFFAEHPEKPISAVLFHQPSVATDLKRNATTISHYFHPYMRNDVQAWIPNGFQFHLTAPVGVNMSGPATDMLIFEFPAGERQEITVYDRYLYQRGNHYVKMQPDGKGGLTGNVNQVASGVFSHVVIELPNDPNKAVLQGRFAPSDQLLIL
jgi:hypothetical protein